MRSQQRTILSSAFAGLRRELAIEAFRTVLKAIPRRLSPFARERGAENDASTAFEAAKIGVGLACLSRYSHIGLDWGRRILGVESHFESMTTLPGAVVFVQLFATVPVSCCITRHE
ncbi:hypothetical protein RE6C_02633 [Rhodopirellula europaea 6C]|uniref:Uncharacterized protein n=1 Tax=Rhodopirellula europaea 6C TaxID=1263867 RepID=M2AV64_9BACT|nr:hypothetical protein RE6C_02633 [Rhodopirellula europaea 6C]|tara:strand:+ start:10877 stop:11224 length:348 start_codon:yes stop_codon:yes gene_type:complete